MLETVRFHYPVTIATMKKIAIVIPAYKPDFLGRVMDSLSAQSFRDFAVYVGDDASPYELLPIIESHQSDMDVTYRRFDSNLGGTDLVAHWRRCIDMSCEPWIILFSDDDLMPSDAVERAVKAIDENPDMSLFRFRLDEIDQNDAVTYRSSSFPSERSTAVEYAVEYMAGRRPSAVCEHVFSRELYRRSGLVSFPMAWCADIATWMRMASLSGGLVNVEGAPCCWRNIKGVNISSSDTFNTKKMDALIAFVQWLGVNFPEMGETRTTRRALYVYVRTVLDISLGGDYSKDGFRELVAALSRLSRICALRIIYHNYKKRK